MRGILRETMLTHGDLATCELLVVQVMITQTVIQVSINLGLGEFRVPYFLLDKLDPVGTSYSSTWRGNAFPKVSNLVE